MSKHTRVILILGAHRTGTKTLAGFFDSQFEEVASVHQYNALRYVNIHSNRFLFHRINRQQFERKLEKIWLPHIRQQTAPIYVESNGFNYVAAQYAIQQLPEVRIVHMVRDPRDFVTSYTNWTSGRWVSKMAYQYVPFWNLSGYETGAFSKVFWKHLTTQQQFAWTWTFKNNYIHDHYHAHQDGYLRLRLEDIINKEKRAAQLQQLTEFVGLPYSDKLCQYFDQKQNESVHQLFPRWQEWTPQQCKNLHYYCYELMEQYGYGQEPEWQEKLKQRA